jgi:ankyrin repeat protein
MTPSRLPAALRPLARALPALVLPLLLGAPPVRAEETFVLDAASQTYAAELRVERCEKDSCGGRLTLLLRKRGAGGPVQTLTVGETVFFKDASGKPEVNVTRGYDVQSVVHFGDFDFDGREDVAVVYRERSGYLGLGYDVYVERDGKLVHSPAFSALADTGRLGMFAVDPKARRLRTSSKSGCCEHETNEYAVVDGRPVLVRTVLETSGNESTVTETLHDPPRPGQDGPPPHTAPAEPAPAAPPPAAAPAAPAPPAAAPVAPVPPRPALQAIILDGIRVKGPDHDTRPFFDKLGQRWRTGLRKMRLALSGPFSFPERYPAEVLPGVEPGLEVAVIGFCRAEQTQAVLARARSVFPKAHAKTVRGPQEEACPFAVDPRAQALVDAVASGRAQAVEAALARGAPVGAAGLTPEGGGALRAVAVTPLTQAVAMGNVGLAQLLLARGAPLSAAGETGTSENLARAVSARDLRMMELLLEAKADASPPSAEPLLLGFHSGEVAVVELLLNGWAAPRALVERSVDPEQPGDLEGGVTKVPVYFLAACHGGPGMLRLMAKWNMDLKARSEAGTTLLHDLVTDCYGPFERDAARAQERRERLDAALALGVPVDAVSKRGRTVLHAAVAAGAADLIAPLLAAGAPVTPGDARGRTVLHAAAAADAVLPQTVRQLVAAGAPVAARDREGRSAADVACIAGSWDLAQVLIELGSPLDPSTPVGPSTPTDSPCRTRER